MKVTRHEALTMFDSLDQTAHFIYRRERVPAIKIVGNLLMQYGCQDHRGRVTLRRNELAAIAADARAEGKHKQARDLERAARVALCLDGNTGISLYHINKPEYISRITHRRRRKRAAERRRHRIG